MKTSGNKLSISKLLLLSILLPASAASIDYSHLDAAVLKINEYDIDAAREHIDKFLSQGRRKFKPTAQMKASADSLNERIDRIEMMLDRVEHIEVVDSMIVNRADFFTHYLLSPSAGSLFDTSSLPDELRKGATGVGYKSPDGRKIIWARTDPASTHLVEASSLTDGSWEQPTPLVGELPQGSNIGYPFMLSDGITLYYAADGEGSLGGLDIWLSRHDGERWLEPQNIGMPYNSPYDDYMMAIDELTGAGWWATDRNQLGDKITIYMFRPNEIRENYPEDTPNIASLAMLSSISDTWRDPKGVTDFLNSFKANASKHIPTTMEEREFALSLGDGRIYYSLDDFKSSAAREAMEDYLILEDDLRIDSIDLNNLRQEYAQGNPGNHNDIILLEEKIRNTRRALAKARNRIIALETGK
ncbi:MAG: hypothetical protein K2L93_00095 [Muribaculaceae bacterium]|nr:hypothetical protein [Muribaculaceae bacterium]